jgi:hypothetical protein
LFHDRSAYRSRIPLDRCTIDWTDLGLFFGFLSFVI